MKTLILDNYDSFTFNLYQEIGELGGNPVVHRNDAITMDDVRAFAPTHIVLSPGPGNPYTKRDIGISQALIDFAAENNIPLLGVCLGHQVLGVHFGATVSRAPSVYHGRASHVRMLTKSTLFDGLSDSIEAMRYHSLCIEPETIPEELCITAVTDDGIVMAVEHRTLPLFGVQFHPESIGTPDGMSLLRNFLFSSCASKTRQPISDLLKILLSDETPEQDREEAFAEYIALPVTAESLAASAQILRESMVRVDLPKTCFDTCGTGGSGKRTINTSTITAFLVAACGGNIAKHGNRSASGNCGSFDLLEKLGVNIQLTPDQERSIFADTGITFLFAPLHHPALRHVVSLRKKHGKRTIFNLLGPLCNPASAPCQLIGTGNATEGQMLSEALALLGTEQSMVVVGLDGLDEVSPSAPTLLFKAPSGTKSYFTPSDLGLSAVSPMDIQGGTPEENTQIFLELAKGQGTDAHRQLVLLNAAHALLISGVSSSLKEGYECSKSTLLSGKVHDLFLRYRDHSHSFQ